MIEKCAYAYQIKSMRLHVLLALDEIPHVQLSPHAFLVAKERSFLAGESFWQSLIGKPCTSTSGGNMRKYK